MKKQIVIVNLIIIFILSHHIVSAIPSFNPYGTNTTIIEDWGVFNYNLTANTSYAPEDLPLSYFIESINSTYYPNENNETFYYWISINSQTGILAFNVTKDNETGRFNISIKVLEKTSQYGDIKPFYFFINASNDAPQIITEINQTYNLEINQTFTLYANGTDEESHWPLIFRLTFYQDCTKHPFNNRTDCNLFDFVSTSINSSFINYTPTKYDSGKYYANLTLMDFGENYTCPSGYCLSNYSQNATYLFPQTILFNVYSYVTVNASDCQNKFFQENQSATCRINITSKDSEDYMSLTSTAYLRNNPSWYVPNQKWFYNSGYNTTSNYAISLLINITPQKDAIGNWTINFSVTDTNFSESASELIYVYVNRTYNDIPRLKNIDNVNTSINAFVTIDVIAYDDDHLTPDKTIYNESLNFSIVTVDQSNNQIVDLIPYNFIVNVTANPVIGTNRTEGKIQFVPNSSIVGNFTVNLTVTDRENANRTITFNMSIKSNNFPLWDTNLNRIVEKFENENIFLNLSKNVSDPDPLDILSFQYSAGSDFPSFNMNLSTGIINFTPRDSDAGFHIVTINVTDGYLVNSTTFNFTIHNIDEFPVIRRPLTISGQNSSGNSNTGMNASEDYSNVISMYVEDPDLEIKQKSYYNETLTIRNLTINGPNSTLFTFTSNPVSEDTNYTLFLSSSFTPRKADVGFYTITINISDITNFSDTITFNLTIKEVFHNPNISLSNQSTIINKNFSYHINVTDLEDGSSLEEGNYNFTFTYKFLNGTDFIKNNQSIFNTTTGKLNYTFNSSEAGRYQILINVTDKQGLNDSKSFWIYVYDNPLIIFPPNTTQYNFAENNTYTMLFTVNHTVKDNLTYEFYLETTRYGKVLRYNISYYGNNTNLTWNFASNFTDETFGTANLTLTVYPSTRSLENPLEINTTHKWNITINHTNEPLQFIKNIGRESGIISGGSPQEVILSDYFYDTDAVDPYYNQTITFAYTTILSTGAISVNYTNWINQSTPIITFSSTSPVTANFTVTAFEWDIINQSIQLRNLTSNNFQINLTISETTTPTPTSGGGGGGSSETKIPYAFKIIVPSTISAYTNQKIKIPLKLINRGKEAFSGIRLSALGFRNNNPEEKITISFDTQNINTLAPNETKDIIMTVFFNTNTTGEYEITVNATSKNPPYTDWSKIYINLQQINETEVKKYILFTEEYIVQNPTCLELKERLRDAKNSVNEGDYANARAIAEEVLNKCKEYVEQVSMTKKTKIPSYTIFQYLAIAILVSIVLGIAYYYLKRKKYTMKQMPLNEYQENKPNPEENLNKNPV